MRSAQPFACADVKLQDIATLQQSTRCLQDAFNISPYCNQALVMHVPEDKLLLKYSPVKLPKSIKNSIEIAGMKKANLKDAVAISEFFYWMEKEVPKNRKDLTELSASDKLEEFKSKQAGYMGPSFFSIVGYGPNGAIIHFSPNNASDRQITTDSTLLVDTGSQYKDGTCDTTRTAHFGTPTSEQKIAYTRVLKGHIDLAMMIWPNSTQGRFLDIIARKELWAGGLDYLHGTGHGIGLFLHVHEGPQAIGSVCPRPNEHPIVPGMFTSDEPGYYKTGSFGIRLETVLLAVPAKVQSQQSGKYFVAFEPANLTPYEKKLIIVDMLTERELAWLNAFHQQSREQVGAMLKHQGKEDVYDWLMEKTEPLGKQITADTNCMAASFILVTSGLLVLLFLP